MSYNEETDPSKKSFAGISKKVVFGAPGTGNIDYVNYPKETKFIFHYQIRLTDVDRTIIDDSRKYGKTMEIYSGKKFQIEVWELCLESMAVGEVASFIVEPMHLLSFAPANKKLRDYMLNKHEHGHAKHCCGMMSLKEQGGLGYPDLDKLMETPQSLEFTFELLKVERPEDVRKESWIMDESEKERTVPIFREEGNERFRTGDYAGAADRYREALGMLEQLVLREKPGEPEWKDLENKKVPLLVNLAQCEINMKEFYSAITHLSDALQIDATNVKAIFRRGFARQNVWNLDEAEEDYKLALSLDQNLSAAVAKELRIIEKLRREKLQSDRELFGGKLFSETFAS